MIGKPASIFVTIRVIKYPTTAGRVLPRISSAAYGRAMISEMDIHMDPAVTEM